MFRTMGSEGNSVFKRPASPRLSLAIVGSAHVPFSDWACVAQHTRLLYRSIRDAVSGRFPSIFRPVLEKEKS